MEKAARGAQPEEEERTDGELNWVQRARLASEVGAETPRKKKSFSGWPHVAQATCVRGRAHPIAIYLSH